MDGADVQMSMSNLVQMDRHQSDVHRAPVVNQGQNAEVARQQAAQRMKAPTEADKTEGRIIDPRNRRDQEQGKKKKQHEKKSDDDPTPDRDDNPIGQHIDFEA